MSDLAASGRRGLYYFTRYENKNRSAIASMEKLKHSKIAITTFEALGARWESNTNRSLISPQYHKLDVWA